MSDTPLHSVSVAGVTFDDVGRVLLIKRRDNGQWQAPGGVLELGETFEEGVIREVLEETGVCVVVERLTGVYKNMKRGVVALVYRCHVTRGFPVPTDEAVEVEWMNVQDAVECMYPSFGVRVVDAARPRGSVESRAHDGMNLL